MLELAVVMAIIVILAALAIPSLSGLTRVSSEGAMRTSLRSLTASARVRAATTQRYAGIRFQQDKDGRSYAVMLEQPAASADWPNGCPIYEPFCTYLTFVAVGDTEPVVLPRGVELAAGDYVAGDDPKLWDPDVSGCVPATTFTVVFSPSGQIVRRQVHVSQRPDSPRRTANPTLPLGWWDSVFNLTAGEPDGRGLFKPDIVLDSSVSVGSPPANHTDPVPDNQSLNERALIDSALDARLMSQTSLWIYERQKRLDAGATPFADYIEAQGALVPLNVYTGAPVNTRR